MSPPLTIASGSFGTRKPIRVIDCSTRGTDCSTRGTDIQHVTTAQPIDLDTPGIVVIDYNAPQYQMKSKSTNGVRLGNNKPTKTKAERNQKRKQAKASKKRNRR